MTWVKAAGGDRCIQPRPGMKLSRTGNARLRMTTSRREEWRILVEDLVLVLTKLARHTRARNR